VTRLPLARFGPMTSLVVAWGVWRLLLGYLGTPEGKQISRDSLIFVGVVLVIGIVSFFLQKKLRKKSQPAQA